MCQSSCSNTTIILTTQVCMITMLVLLMVGSYMISPGTDLEWPRGFQEVKAPRFLDNGTGMW